MTEEPLSHAGTKARPSARKNNGGRLGAQIEDLIRGREGSRQDVPDSTVRDGPVRRPLRADARRESREENDAGGDTRATREGRHDDGDLGHHRSRRVPPAPPSPSLPG